MLKLAYTRLVTNKQAMWRKKSVELSGNLLDAFIIQLNSWQVGHGRQSRARVTKYSVWFLRAATAVVGQSVSVLRLQVKIFEYAAQALSGSRSL